MTSTDFVNEKAIAWLLEEESPGVRYLALRDLLDLPDSDKELTNARKHAHEFGPIATVLAQIDDEGFWVKAGPGYSPKYKSGVWSLILLAQLGASIKQDAGIAKACDYYIEHTLTPGGQFSASASSAPSYTIDCLQGNMCWALMELGVDYSRLAHAYEWMARSVTGEGIAPKEDKHADVRYYAYKCGPDFQCGANHGPCAWGATKVALALGKLPQSERIPQIDRAIQRTVDFFFSMEPATASWGPISGKPPSRDWWLFGFPVFYITDLLQVAEALTSLGYGPDPRLAPTFDLIRQKADEQHHWKLEYAYGSKTWGNYGMRGKPNKWVTLRALRVLKTACGGLPESLSWLEG
jgi:hypothetical protein